MTNKTASAQRKQTHQESPAVPSIDTRDRVDEASYDSFPASDPPSHNSAHKRPGEPVPPGKPVKKPEKS